jgi:hypothetical protein
MVLTKKNDNSCAYNTEYQLKGLTGGYMKVFMYMFLIIPALFNISFPQEHLSQLRYLSNNSDVILTGKVVQKKSEWAGNKTKIITIVTVAADEYLKGSSSNEITVICLGGEADGTGELYTHMPVFTLKENVLLFLKKDRNNYNFTVFAGEAGKLTLYDEQAADDKLTIASVKLSVLKKEIRSILENKQ